MEKIRVLAISPVPESICLAAQCRDKWDDLQIAGRQLIVAKLYEWNQDPSIKEILIMVPDIADVQAVRTSLKKLNKGIRVTWFSGNLSVVKACEGFQHVHCVKSEVMADGVSSKLLRHKDKPSSDKPDLLDYLRYKITLAFMRSLDPGPLKEAANVIAKHSGKTFDLADVVPDDIKSIEHMRDADFPYLEGQSAKIVALKNKIQKIAPSDISVLITGETGTGKEAVAFYLHEFSKRRLKPFVSINCAGLQEEFLRSELFGHVKGAYTGAEKGRPGLIDHAKGGTLFLDELGDMPLNIQADLLRFLQTKRYRTMGDDREKHADIRVIAAAQPDIRAKMEAKELRLDLYYRIAEMELRTPSLADVPEDIMQIVRHLAYRLRDGKPDGSRTVEQTITYFKTRQDEMRNHIWPGNVRDLVRLVKQYMYFGYDVFEDLKEDTTSGGVPAGKLTPNGMIAMPDKLRPVEEMIQQYVTNAWENRGDLTQAELASRLGISINTLKKHLQIRK